MKDSRAGKEGRRRFLKTLGLGSGALLLKGSALGGAIAVGVASPARATGTTVFDPLVDPTLQGFTEYLLNAVGTPNIALGLFEISDPPSGHLYYRKPFAAASSETSLSCYVQVGTGASTAGSVGAYIMLEQGTGLSGPFSGRLELHCILTQNTAGVLVPALGILDQAGQFSHSILFDWYAGGTFEFGRRANGNAFINVPGASSIEVPASQILGPLLPEPTLAFGCPIDAAALLAQFGAITSSSTFGTPVPSISGPWLPSALAAAGYMALRWRCRRDDKR